jgi:hypothetical protein
MPENPKSDAAGRVAALVAVTVLLQQVLMGRAVAGLSVILGLAFVAWRRRPPPSNWRADRLFVVFVAGIAVQVAHFIEELGTGFAREFPALLGYAWSDSAFFAFNAAWLLVFLAAAGGVRRRSSEALVLVWFFAFAAIGNGVVHVLLAAGRGAYFPGVVTALALFPVGVVLMHRLLEVTRTDGQEDRSASPA